MERIDESPAASHAVATELRRTLGRSLALHDRPAAVRDALETVHAGGIGVLDLYDLVLVPVLLEVGAGWQLGTTQVWEEHLASHTVRTIIESLYPTVTEQAATRPSTGRTVLLACPPQELHDLGLRMLCDRFALSGWTTMYLGPDTPVDEICDAARAVEAELVVLSASTHLNRTLLRAVVDEIIAGLPDVRVMVGGPAFALDREWPAEELFDPVAWGLPAPRTGA